MFAHQIPVLSVTLCALLLATQATRAEHQPLWELGAGISYLDLPDYRGSDERTTYIFPYPYFVYRGDRLQVGDGRIRGLLVERSIWQVDISINGTVPVNSSTNSARQGMPDLDASFEVGPSITISAVTDDLDRDVVRINLPVRYAAATNPSLDVQGVGWVFNPHVDYILRGRNDGKFWRLTLSAGPIFATADYHDYYYGVEPQFATATRPEYAGKAGYSGTRLLASGFHQLTDSLFIGGFLRYDQLSEAAFEESPLMRREQSLMAGLALTWSGWKSERHAKHLD